MGNVVYFLGAGNSKNFGYPLTGEIMPQVFRSLLKKDLFQLSVRGKTEEEKRFEKDLLHYIYLLYPGLERRGIENANIPDITEILSFVDYSCFYNLPPHPELHGNKLKHFQHLLNRAVAELLLDYDIKEYEKEEQDLLDHFIKPLKREKKENDVTVITTNYDLSIDNEFRELSKNNLIDYGISYRNIQTNEVKLQPANPLFRYYKLHGSLNWLKCDYCGHYYINPDANIAYLAFRTKLGPANTCICNDSIRLNNVLVAPSLVRDIRDSNLLQIWRSAMESIRTADKLIFIGYSLPPEDFGIKSIIMRGINGRIKKNSLQIDVVQLGTAAKPRYINLLGEKINYNEHGLANYLQI